MIVETRLRTSILIGMQRPRLLADLIPHHRLLVQDVSGLAHAIPRIAAIVGLPQS
jgi:hypothetical protein